MGTGCPVCVGVFLGEASWLAPELSTCPQVPLVMKALQRQLKDRNVRTRQGCFNLLTELAGVLPGSLADHMPALVSGTLGYSWLSTLGSLLEHRSLPYSEPSIPEGPGIISGQSSVQ